MLVTSQIWPKRQRKIVFRPPFPWPPIATSCKNPWESFQTFTFIKGYLRLLPSAVGQGGKKPPSLKIPDLCPCPSETLVLTGRDIHHGPEGIYLWSLW